MSGTGKNKCDTIAISSEACPGPDPGQIPVRCRKSVKRNKAKAVSNPNRRRRL
jgi:hypothetical protein